MAQGPAAALPPPLALHLATPGLPPDWEPQPVVQRLLAGHSDTVTALLASRDGARLYSASHDCTVRLWDAASGCCAATLRGHTGRAPPAGPAAAPAFVAPTS